MAETFTVERFKEEIQRYECLYDKFSRNFKDKYKIIDFWTKVGHLFEMSVEQAEEKIQIVAK